MNRRKVLYKFKTVLKQGSLDKPLTVVLFAVPKAYDGNSKAIERKLAKPEYMYVNHLGVVVLGHKTKGVASREKDQLINVQYGNTLPTLTKDIIQSALNNWFVRHLDGSKDLKGTVYGGEGKFVVDVIDYNFAVEVVTGSDGFKPTQGQAVIFDLMNYGKHLVAVNVRPEIVEGKTNENVSIA